MDKLNCLRWRGPLGLAEAELGPQHKWYIRLTDRQTDRLQLLCMAEQQHSPSNEAAAHGPDLCHQKPRFRSCSTGPTAHTAEEETGPFPKNRHSFLFSSPASFPAFLASLPCSENAASSQGHHQQEEINMQPLRVSP